MKFGLKLWSSNINLIKQATRLIDEKAFDYIELAVVPNTHITPFKIDVPYVLHCPQEQFGVNAGSLNKKKYTLQKINETLNWADELNAKHVIMHPGYGSLTTAIKTLSEVKDKRVLIENVPKIGLNNEHMIGYSPEQITDLTQSKHIGLCLDFGHAIKAAISLKKDYKEYIKEFIKLKPKIFHINDGTLINEKDEHLNIGSGNYDFKLINACITDRSSKLITLETMRFDNESLDEDLANKEKLKTYFI